MKDITYTNKNGVLYPDYELPKQTDYPIGKYGQMRLDFIKKHRRGTYSTLLTKCRLNEYLHKIDMEARERVDELMEAFKKSDAITEELKASDPLLWVQKMNAAKSAAEEIVYAEVITL